MENVFKPMQSGFSSPREKFSPVSTAAYQFGTVMSGNEPAKMNLSNPDQGNFQLEMDMIPSALIYKTKIYPFKDHFAMPLFRQEPTLTLMFQEQGTTLFNRKGSPLVMGPGQHSLNFFPDFDCSMTVHRDDISQNTSIKLKPDYFKEFFISNQHLGGWLYEKIEKNVRSGISITDLIISPEMRVILHQIRNCPYESELKNLYIDGLIRIILTHQLDAYNQTVLNKKPVWQDQKLSVQDAGKLHEVRDFVNGHYPEVMSLSVISRKFGLNEFKLKYGFKKMFGIPVMQYILDLRLNNSRHLLKESDKSIFEIAQIAGYEHANNFSACFKKRFGQTPQQYRNLKKSGSGRT